jgi:hypothetical protein
MAKIQDSKLDLLLTPRIPQGLAAAVEGLTREVIRHQPENIYVFAADHFEKLLRLREQYGNDTVKKKNMKFLSDISEAIKERHVDSKTKEKRNSDRCNKWSLNETAEVLEKHRRIFGEDGHEKISTAKIRELAKESILMPTKIQSTTPKKKYEAHRAENKNRDEKYVTVTSSRRKESSHHHSKDLSNLRKSDYRSTPKIIPQIPLVKDIKTELKRNRMNSRERKKTTEEKRMQVSCEYIKETTIEKTFKKSIEKTKKVIKTPSEQKKNVCPDDSMKRKADIAMDKKDSRKIKKASKTPKMDEIRNYVVQNFVGMTRLDELQSPSYVERVQEVIDETSMIIKEKVEALKTGIINAAKANQLKGENSLNNDEYFNSLKKSSDSDNKMMEGNLFKSSSYQNISRSSDFINAIQDNSENSEKSENSENSENLESLDNISLPAVRPPSSKSTSRSVSSRSNSDSLILPPISPESSKSTKIVEELVLPALTPAHSTSITPDSINCNKISPEARNEDEFQDSLNITPDLIDATQRCDSLETFEMMHKNGCLHETLKSKLLEIENVQQRIENVLDETPCVTDEKDEAKGSSQIQDKLIEIQESEKRIERILDSQAAPASQPQILNTDVKSKLQELEDTEKRIENIFIRDTDKTCTDDITAFVTDSQEKNNLNENNVNEDLDSKKENKENKENNSSKNVNSIDFENNNAKLSELNICLSPHSYVLTEGSPYDIPDSVTTVIIPDRCSSPDFDTLQVEIEDGNICCSTLISSKERNDKQRENYSNKMQEKQSININDAFGEVVNLTNLEASTADIDFIRGIKVNHNIMVPRQDLDLIQEERDKEFDDSEIIDSEDERVLKVVTSSLEEILEKNKLEYVSKEEIELTINNTFGKETNNYLSEAVEAAAYESTDETKETSLQTDGLIDNSEIIENSFDIEETTGRSIESTNEIKETSVTTDRSSLSLDPVMPFVPELNLDSLSDLTISSFNVTDDEQKEENKTESKDLNPSEISISSTGTYVKDHSNIDKENQEEKMPTENEVKEIDIIQSNLLEIIETLKDDSLFKSETSSNECIEKLRTKNEDEVFEKKEYNNVREDDRNEIEVTTDNSIFDKLSVNEKENVEEDDNEDRKVEDNTLADDSIPFDSEMIDIKQDVEVSIDKINDSLNDIYANKELIMSLSGSEENVLADQCDNAESSLTDVKSDPQLIKQESPREIDTDQHNQFVDSSKVSSQCTNRLNSDILIERSTDNAIKNNLSQDINALQEEETIISKAHNNNVIVPEDASFAESEVKNIDDTTDNEKKQVHIYVPDNSISNDGSSTASSTFMSAATKIQAGESQLKQSFVVCLFFFLLLFR